MTDKPSKPRGRPSIFRKVLGKGVNENLRFPAPIHALLKEIPVKRLLDWMAVDSAYKKKILEQVPEEDPPESIS